eukprot:1233784-Rhodomonas_salina.2
MRKEIGELGAMFWRLGAGLWCLRFDAGFGGWLLRCRGKGAVRRVGGADERLVGGDADQGPLPGLPRRLRPQPPRYLARPPHLPSRELCEKPLRYSGLSTPRGGSACRKMATGVGLEGGV